MKSSLALSGFLLLLFVLSVSPANGIDLVFARDGSGVYGYDDTPTLPWCPWRVHDPNSPAPRRVDPGPAPPPVPAPADATVLFNGHDLSAWEYTDCTIEGSCMVAGNGPLRSKQQFGDCQIHLEWMGPADFDGPWHNRGNNGVLLMGVYEIQIFDSYNEKIYPD